MFYFLNKVQFISELPIYCNKVTYYQVMGYIIVSRINWSMAQLYITLQLHGQVYIEE